MSQHLRAKWLRRKQSPKGFRPRWRGFCKRGHPKRVVTLDDHWEVVDLGNPHMGKES